MANRIEPLESRRLLSVITWDGGGDDTTWNNAANWVGDALPATGDDVVIDTAGPRINLPNGLHFGSFTLNREVMLASSLTIDGTFRIKADGLASAGFQGAPTIDGTGSIEVETGGELRALYTGGGPSIWLKAKIHVVNHGTVFVTEESAFAAGIANFGQLILHGQGNVYGPVTNEEGGNIEVYQGSHSPATSDGAHIKVGLSKSDAGAISAVPFINRGTIRNDYKETITGLSLEYNGVVEAAAGLTVYVDATPTLGGTWGAWQNALRFTRYDTSAGNAPLSVDSTFSFMHGTLYLSKVDATLSGLSSNTGLSLFGTATATLDAPRTNVALLRVYGTSTISLAEGDRVLRAEAIEVFDNGKISIGDGLLIHGNQPGYLRFWITEPPAAMPGYSNAIGGSVSGSPITIEPNGNPRGVGYTDGSGLAFRYPSHAFRGETFDDNDFIFFATLRGDTNFDRHVNFDDLLLVAKRYGQPANHGYIDGNFSGSVTGSGAVAFDDLLILAQNYGQTFVAAPSASPSSSRVKRNVDLVG